MFHHVRELWRLMNEGQESEAQRKSRKLSARLNGTIMALSSFLWCGMAIGGLAISWYYALTMAFATFLFLTAGIVAVRWGIKP